MCNETYVRLAIKKSMTSLDFFIAIFIIIECMEHYFRYNLRIGSR